MRAAWGRGEVLPFFFAVAVRFSYFSHSFADETLNLKKKEGYKTLNLNFKSAATGTRFARALHLDTTFASMT